MFNPMSQEARTVLVTGASSGIGRETAIVLSKLGARVIAAGRNEERLAETLCALEGEGHRSEAFDLSDTAGIPEWLRRVSRETGALDGLVHCAGVHFLKPLRLLADADLERLMSVNLNAAVALSKGYRQKGVRADDGSLVFIASVAGLVGQAGMAAYAASKGALIALTKSLAMELARERIRVNTVAAAMVRTDMASHLTDSLTAEQAEAVQAMHPLGFGEPRDVAYAACYLLGETGRWITGSTLVVDGGYTAH